MKKKIFGVVGTEEIIDRIQQSSVVDGVELGSRQPTDSYADAVDAVLGPEEIKTALEILTMAFSTGAVAIDFFRQLREYLRDGESVRVLNLKSGDLIAEISADSNTPDLNVLLDD